MQRLLQYNGIDPARFQVKWISGSEAAKFRDTVTEVSAQIKALGPNHRFVAPYFDGTGDTSNEKGGMD